MTIFNVNTLIGVFTFSDPAEYPDLFESNADSSYISGKQRNSDLVLR